MGTLPIMKCGEEELVSSIAMLTYLGGEAGKGEPCILNQKISVGV